MKTVFLSIIVTIIAICFGNSASAQILNPRPLPGHHVHPRPNHPRHWHHNPPIIQGVQHDNGLHKGWSNPHNPHSGLKGYKRKD